jgi:hypothetical protein
MTTANLLRSYEDGDFTVSIFADGTKVREGTGIAEFPESMDVKITNWCDAGCKWCHEGSTRAGKHGDLRVTTNLIKQLPAGVEIAIGGGHPLAHPDFARFVEELSDAGIICNVTINEKHFEGCLPEIERLLSKGHIYGVGYSYSQKPCTWKFDNLVTHIIVGITHPQELEKIVAVNDKVLLLGYKTFGRGAGFVREHSAEVKGNISAWYRHLFSAARKAHLSFDNLAISQLQPARLLSVVDYDAFYMGRDGAHSMYMDAIKQEYGVSSTSTERMAFTDSLREMFANVRPQ